jgi:hypothetical protein
MKSLMQRVLGDDWEKLPSALKAHYHLGPNVDIGHLDIEFPRWMKPYLWLLHLFGALLTRSGRQVPTQVEKEVVAGRVHWRRTMSFPDGATAWFDSFWVSSGGNQLIEFVNPVMGLEMAVHVEGDELRYEGVRYVLIFGRMVIGLPEWLILGHTTIAERGLSARSFAMDFRLTHPLFGEVFRYAGTFVTKRLDP